eukprot:625540-Rhodomonas_salina.2
MLSEILQLIGDSDKEEGADITDSSDSATRGPSGIGFASTHRKQDNQEARGGRTHAICCFSAHAVQSTASARQT